MVREWGDRRAASEAALARLLQAGAATLSHARTVHRLQQAVLLLAALWCTFSLAGIAWSLLPQREAQVPSLTDIINPVQQAAAPAPALRVDIERVAGWHLFGDPVSASAEELSRLEARRQAAAGAPAGIEDRARDTRLPLILRGAVSSAEDTAGYAMIEYQGRQAVYAVGDQLPVPGQVRLAKVLASRVIVDNSGSYEALRLFEDSGLFLQAGGSADAETAQDMPLTAAEATGQAREVGNASLAAQYRDRLYRDPQSLAEVVQVAPVRRDGDLVGYRLSPGRAADDFTALGFEPGDIVTAVNGLSLSDPANALRLYQAMRDERAAVFELQRDGSELVLSVQLPENGRP